MNGTPFQRQLSISTWISARVSVPRAGVHAFLLWRSPAPSLPPDRARAVYRARRVDPAYGALMLLARRTVAMASRRSRSTMVAGGSMAIRAMICRRWLWIMSRRAPAPS